ncbi:MAG: hypothetical protein AAFX99_31430, partial [Myxococcota bacterium]
MDATYPSGQTITSTYDDADRLTSIEELITTIGYDDRNLIMGMDYADGSAMAMMYDDLLRPT